MSSMKLVILLLITLLFLNGCGYWPHEWSEEGIRKIVREEIQNETSNR